MNQPCWTFGDYVFDPNSYELRRGGADIPLAPLPARILATLIADAGRVVSRDRLYEVGWGANTISVDLALNSAIREVRRALRDSAANPRFVQTLPHRGYRFVAAVTPAARVPSTIAGPLEPISRFERALATIGARPRLAGAALLALLAVSIVPREPPTPTVRVEPIRVIDHQASASLVLLLETRIRTAVVRRGGSRLSVLETSGQPSVATNPPDYLIRSILLRTPRGPLLDISIVRAADRSIVWAGGFNPECPAVADAPQFIAEYVAAQVTVRAS